MRPYIDMARFILTFLPFTLPLYLIRFRIGSLPTTLLEIYLLIFLAIWTWKRGWEGWKNALKKLREQKWIGPLILWLVAGIVAIFISSNFLSGLGLWRAYFLEPVLVFVMLTDLIHTDKDKKTLARSLIITIVIMGAWAIIQRLTGWSLPHPWDVPPNGPRATGPFPYPNALALFCVPVTAYCFWMGIKNCRGAVSAPRFPESIAQGGETPPLQWLPWLGFASGLVATILAESDGGLIALAAACFVVLALTKKTRLITLIVVGVGLITALIIPKTRLVLERQFFFQEWSGKVRLVMWKETWNMLKDHPITGVGLSGYPDGIKPYHQATWMEIFQYPHNIVLNLWSEVGLLGLVAFGWILWRWLAPSSRPPSSKLGALPCASTLAVIGAILVHGLVDVPYFKNDLAVLFWILVALTTKIAEKDILPAV